MIAPRFLLLCAAALGAIVALRQPPAHSPAASGSASAAPREFAVRGVIKELKPDGRTVVIKHEEIRGFMDAMTMPFKTRDTRVLEKVRAGDEVSFRLWVTEDESWIDRIVKTGTASTPTVSPSVAPSAINQSTPSGHPLKDYNFTNELGEAVSLNQFKGQALAITFIFTRCPIPDFCPRLSKNFQEASRQLSAMPAAPTNWHFLSVSFDPEYDTPEVLRAYARQYDYDPQRWSFLTGPADKIAELAKLSDVSFKAGGGFFDHNFRTLIIDAAGRLQMTFPTSGDLSDAIAREMLAAAAAKEERNATTSEP